MTTRLTRARELLRDGDVAAARQELIGVYRSELVADCAVAGLGSAFDRFIETLHRFGAADHATAGNLGIQLYLEHRDVGDEVAAQVILELLIEHAPPLIAAAAAVPRAAHFARAGDYDRADKLYLWAMDAGDPTVLAVSGYNLAGWWEERHDIQAAITVYQRVLESGAGVAVAGSGLRLGTLLVEQGDHDGAHFAYRCAAGFDCPEGGDAAIALMRSLLGGLSDVEVDAALRAAAETIQRSGRPEAVAYAHNLIGMAAKDAGDDRTAGTHLRRAVEMSQPISEFASTALSQLYEEQG